MILFLINNVMMLSQKLNFSKEVFKKLKTKKFKIDGLSLNQIYAYELEQPLSNYFSFNLY